ncbi:unnamed protein product [Orchesella dallaii]|uniref:Uncharacterized protein n=1 Tax=Orchesella dallaii TaxID=48710 RepID=A0ABP1R1B0_9HEXA
MGFRRLGNALLIAVSITFVAGKNLPICDLKLDAQTSEDEMVTSLTKLVVTPTDDAENVSIKTALLEHLVKKPELRNLFTCKTSRLLQEDGDDGDDGDDGGGGGGGAGGAAGGALDNTNVLNGVRRILANVFTGNLIGVVQESVGLRGPEGVTTVFTDVLSTLFGSQATAGITGIIGNITTTAAPLAETTTLPYNPYLHGGQAGVGGAGLQGLTPQQLQQLQALTPQQLAVLQNIRNQQLAANQLQHVPLQQPASPVLVAGVANQRPAGNAGAVQGGVVQPNRNRVQAKPQQQQQQQQQQEADYYDDD